MAQESEAESLSHLKGFGGWLMFFAATLVLGLIQYAIALFASPSPFQLALIVLMISLTLYGFNMLATEDERAPAYWTVTLAAMALFALTFGAYGALARSLIWLLYWANSKRVLVTFGSTGLAGRLGLGRRIETSSKATA